MATIYENIKTDLLNLKTLFDDKITYIEDSLKKYDDRISLIEKKIKNISNLENEEEINENLVSIQKEYIEIDENIVLRALTYKDYRSILMIFKHYYKRKENIKHKYPIRCVGKRSFEYFKEDKWINDTYGHYIRNTIMINIQTLLFKFNTQEYFSEISEILLNQDFIYKISEEKYMKSYFRHIVDEVKNS